MRNQRGENINCSVISPTLLLIILLYIKPIFILDNQWSRNYIPEGIGLDDKSVDELYELMRQDNSAKVVTKKASEGIIGEWIGEKDIEIFQKMEYNCNTSFDVSSLVKKK